MRSALLLGGALLALASGAQARVTAIHVETRTPAPLTPGERPYEIITGTFEGDVSPQRDAIITDIAQAPRQPNGRVAYSATFAIARPLKGGSGVLFYDVPNRGNGKVGPDEDGHIRVISGWQGDLAPAPGVQTATVPTAKGLTGLALARATDLAGSTWGLTGGIGRPVPRPLPVDLDPAHARLYRQGSDAAPLQPIPPDQWAFADCRAAPFPGTPDPARICLKGGFDPGQAYTLVYQARDPLVLGIGFAATRDLVAFLRHARTDDHGTPNPLAGQVRWSVVSGTSQSGNFVKSFINLGFNQDETGARVFDGANPNIAARQVPLNLRFAVPGGAATLFEPGSEGTLWWTRYADTLRGRGRHSLLDRCSATHTCPKIMETFGSTELWGLRLSPALVGTDARADVPITANVRRYYFPGVTHGGSYTGGISLDGDKPWPGAPVCVLPNNPNPSLPTMRALLKRLVQWVSTGRPPPPSQYPTLAHGDLVAPTAATMGWPAIPGAPVPDGKLNELLDYDYGPGFDYPDLSGVITRQPPAIRRTIRSLVPRVDGDGNELGGGVPSVQHLVPLGTYLGWNVLAHGYGAGGPCGFAGGFIPFAVTRAERLAKGDPRPSLEERYGTHAGFVARIKAVAARRVKEGWLLPDDAARLVAEAETSPVLRQP
ncbi:MULTISPECIES: alpha/beta hydrolase domain-containing protein [unclassified Sphingomonas]|uniref:alpha/beta hydrolase domain-containing protein n=1 Tax=Novosphingobium rhizosphaerae TaxID=1551649 RepID=UPI0015CDB53C